MKWKIEIRQDPQPFLARIIIADKWRGRPGEAKRLLERIYDEWPKSKKVKFIITCGGFIEFDWPKSVSKKDIGDCKEPNLGAVNVLINEAEKCVKSILNKNLRRKLKTITDYISLGIDACKERIPINQGYQCRLSRPHIELVVLIDLINNRFYWTGKSYPTSEQERGLVRISDLTTHFLNLKVGKVMVLGCHDLNMFNNRNWKNTGKWRRNIKIKLRNLAKKEKPVYVLQHPHTTVKVNTWRNAWSQLVAMLPSVEMYAGAGRYYEHDRKPSEYDELYDVLKYTKRGDTIDFIIKR